MKVYKIRDKTNGLFYTTSGFKKWTQIGKTYSSLSGARSTMTNSVLPKNTTTKDFEIVEYEMKETNNYPLKD